MKLYLAAPWEFKREIGEEAKRLELLGYEITQPWWMVEDSDDPAEGRKQATNDLKGIEAADVLVLYDWKSSQGKATELGFAVGRFKPALYVTSETSSNVFRHHPYVLAVKYGPELDSTLRTIHYLMLIESIRPLSVIWR